jgi:hypothetical protein
MNAIDQRLRNMRLGVVKLEAGIISDKTQHMIEEDDRALVARRSKAFAGI